MMKIFQCNYYLTPPQSSEGQVSALDISLGHWSARLGQTPNRIIVATAAVAIINQFHFKVVRGLAHRASVFVLDASDRVFSSSGHRLHADMGYGPILRLRRQAGNHCARRRFARQCSVNGIPHTEIFPERVVCWCLICLLPCCTISRCNTEQL